MLLAPESTSDLDRLRVAYERRAEAYRFMTDPMAQEGAYQYLMALLARVRELLGYPAGDFFCGLSRVDAPSR